MFPLHTHRLYKHGPFKAVDSLVVLEVFGDFYGSEFS